MEKNLTEFFETEMAYVKVGLAGEDDLIQRNNICWYARQRALGAIYMAQICGLDYQTTEAMFYAYVEQLDQLVSIEGELK